MRPPTVAIATLAFALAFPASAAELTLERLREAPGLSGPAPRKLAISPDARLVTYLRPRPDDPLRYDLWAFDVESGTERELVDADLLEPAGAELSEEERGRRERQRTAALGGIVEYDLAPDGRSVLVPVAGDLFVVALDGAPDRAVRRLTETDAYETDARFSPGGRYVGFVRDHDLFVIDLEDGAETAITVGGDGTVRYGEAEFVAQEEMDRDTGYWFSGDDSRVAFTRVDLTPVAVEERFEVLAGEVRTHRQRYPAAGTSNALVELHVAALDGGDRRRLDLGDDPDVYLARVAWFPDDRHVAAVRQSRDQRTVDLIRLDVATGEGDVLLTERSETWVELHDDFRFLGSGGGFVWGSSRTGFHHLYLYRDDGTLVRPLTSGDWVVGADGRGPGLLAIDEPGGFVYFVGTLDGPTERHLYRSRIAEGARRPPERLTTRPGWHDVAMSRDATVYVDTHSTVDRPPNVALVRTGGPRIAWIEENALDPTHPYHPYLDRHGSTEFGRLPASDGQALWYSLLRPADFDPGRSYPVVVAVYGGPHGQRVRNRWNRDLFDRWLVRNGFLVFRLDNRGTGWRGTAFDDPIHGRLGTVEVEDQARGVAFLRTLPYVDPGRIGISGWSYGGTMALLCATRTPDLFAAAVSGAPVTDWRLYDTHYTERYMGDPEERREAYDRASALHGLERLKAPLLVVHGMADDNVLFAHSTKLFAALQTANLPFEVMVYPGEKHALRRTRVAGLHADTTIARFLVRHLRSRGE